jgi:hypothetical protein
MKIFYISIFATFTLISCSNGDENKSKNEALTSNLRLASLVSELKQSDNPQKYMDMGICYEAMYKLMTRSDDYKLNLEELNQTKVVQDINGPMDEAAKLVINEFCPGGINELCLQNFPQNAKGWFSGTGSVIRNFSSSSPNTLISGESPGNNPLVQRQIMRAYCSKFGYQF